MPKPPVDFDFSNPKNIAELLQYAANRVVRGDLDHKSAYALGYLADCALRAHDVGALSERIDRIERLQAVEAHIPVGSDDYLETDFEEELDEQNDNGPTENPSTGQASAK